MSHHHFFNEMWVVVALAATAAFIGQLFVDWLIKEPREKVKKDIKEKGIDEDIYKYTESITKRIGYAERTLYIFAICFGQPGFIAIWLALKTAVHWRAWSDNDKDGKGNKYGDALSRAIFNLFVLGNAASLLAAVLTIILFILLFPMPHGFHWAVQ